MISNQIYSNICLITISNQSTHKLVENVIFAVKQNILLYFLKHYNKNALQYKFKKKERYACIKQNASEM